MCGGNHPEHVQQADQNRPSCSQCPHVQNSVEVSEKAALNPVSHSSCCSSSIRSAESEIEEECSCRKRFCHEESRNCGHRGRSTSSVDDICGHRVRKCQVAGASASLRCASLDSQLQNNNKNINGIGRGLENSSSKILTPSTTSTASGQHDSAVDTVHDKFSQLQSQLNVGVDSLKDYIATLCLALKNNQTPGEQAAWRDSEHPPPHLPSSAFCCSPSSSPPPPGRIPHILKSCSRHSPPWEVTPCNCCASRCERMATGYCQKRSAVLVSPGMYSLCRNSGKSFEACHCCSNPRQNLSGPRCSSRLADNRIDKGSCCQLALVEMKASPSPSSHTSCADVPQLACLSSPGASPTPSPHSSQYHCTCQRGHGTIPETWEPSSSQVEDFTDHFDHRRICRLHKTRSHRMKKSHFWATGRSSFHPVSFKESRSSTENSDSESAFGNKETNTLVSNVCERSFPNNKAKRKDLLQASGNNERIDEATADQQKINLGADDTGASSLEVQEQNCDEGTQSKVERVHRAVGSDHSCQTTVVSPRVVDIAVSIVEALLRAQNSEIPYLQKHLLPCRRVGSSSVDREIPSCESQTMSQNENLAEREECVNNICRKLLNDVAQQNFCSTDSKVQNTDLRRGSERTTGNSNVDCSEAKCTCSVSPVHSSCSGTSCDVDKLEKSLHRTLLGEQLEKQQNNDCGKQDKGTVGLLARCSHKYEKSQNVLSTKTNNENRSNSSASKCCTFLVCVGEENHSSALVIQPLVPSETVQFKDSACQASDESVCTSLETSANWAQRFLETCHSDSCVDCLMVDGGSNNIYSTILASGSGEMNGQTGSETVLESTDSPLKEADDAVTKDTHVNVQIPVSGQTEPESAGGDSSFPVDFSQCGLKDAPFPHAECSVDRESLGAHAGCYFSDSGILTDSARPSVHMQHKDSPSCSMGSVSTTAVTSSCSSVANLSHASSPVDPFLGIYSLTKACPQTIGSTASTLDCVLEEYAQERKPGETSVFAGNSSSRNNSHKRVTVGSSTIVDCGAGGMDADLTVKRSWSSEQVQGSSRTGQSGTRDSWMSLELLNLNSRAARLAIESRVQSLQRILNDMESCTRVLTPSSGRPAAQQQPSSHSTASSLTASAAAAAAEAATAATPRDHWLRACNSEELVQSAALPECEARDNTNTNTNHVPTRDACTNASCDTHSIGTITDICRQVAVTHCLCTIDKLHTGNVQAVRTSALIGNISETRSAPELVDKGDPERTGGNLKRELEEENTATVSFGATFNRQRGTKRQKLNDTRNQGVCAAIQEDFTPANTRSFSDGDIAMITKACDCCAMAAKDGAEKRQMSGETEDVLRDLDDSSFGDKMFGMDAGVQCDILMSCTVPRPRAREAEDCESRNLTGFSNTDRLSSNGSKAEEASSSVADAGQQRQSSEGEVLRQYRRRVRSLEQALDLERDLHTITRASLRDLTSDHDVFRDSMLLLHDRPRSHTSGDGHREMLRRAVERTGAAQSLWQDCVRGARERERDSVRRGMGP
ncbi:hypothetical protein ACOMHN_017266 [Nucella lapillus]